MLSILNLTCLARGREILIIGLIFGFITLIFSSVGGSDQEDELLDLEGAPELEKVVKKNRVVEPLSPRDMEEKLVELLYPYQDFDEVDPDQIGRVDKKLYRLSKDEMLEDIDFLFRVLKYGYAGYSLFGGDEKFGQSQEAMIDEVKKNARQNNGEPFLALGGFRKIVRENLSFIEDGHFAVDGERFFQHQKMHIDHELEFKYYEDGYFIREGEEKIFLETVNGHNPEKYLKLSLNDTGELVYKLVALSPKEESYPVTLTFQGQEAKELTLHPAANEVFLQVPYEQYEKDGVPVVVNRRLFAYNEEKLNEFTAAAKDLQDEEITILDLRGNPGGSDRFAVNWIKNYSSHNPSYAHIYIDLTTQTSQALQVSSAEERGADTDFFKQRYSPTRSGWSDIDYSTPKTIPNDRYLLVLIDNRIGSAGESFVRMLQQMENVILIGSNTQGVKTVGNIVSFSLPNSGTNVQIGTTLFLELDLNIIEGRGYAPDVWVEPKYALDAALKFIDNYLR